MTTPAMATAGRRMVRAAAKASPRKSALISTAAARSDGMARSRGTTSVGNPATA
jgi:hypothetical protein